MKRPIKFWSFLFRGLSWESNIEIPIIKIVYVVVKADEFYPKPTAYKIAELAVIRAMVHLDKKHLTATEIKEYSERPLHKYP